MVHDDVRFHKLCEKRGDLFCWFEILMYFCVKIVSFLRNPAK